MKKILSILLVLALMTAIFTGCAGNEDTPKDTGPRIVTDDTPVEKGNVFGKMISIVDNGAKEGGDEDVSAAFDAKGVDALYIPAGKYKIANDLEINLPVKFELGAVLSVETGVTVKFNDIIDAPVCKIFEGGAVVLAKNGVSYPEWFGAVADGKTDSTKAIQKAINCFPEGFGKVCFDSGKYMVSDTIKIGEKQKFLTLEGQSVQLREVYPGICMSEKCNKPVLKIKGTTNGNTYDGSLEGVTVKYLEFTREKMGGEGTDTIYIEDVAYTTFEYVGFAHSQNGLHAVNCNGLRIYVCHGTTGGNIPGKEVRGIYIDGSEKGCTGILIDDYIYYGYASTESKSYAYKDVCGVKAIGTNVGDRRIRNFECAGPVNYDIAIISDSSGWAGDIAISDVSMDNVKSAGLYFKARQAQTFQTANICNCYFHLDTPEASGIIADTYSNLNVSTFVVDNATDGAANTGMVFKNCFGGTISSTVFTGKDYKNIATYENCRDCVFTGNTSVFRGSLSLDEKCSNIVVSGNSMSKVLLNSVSENNLIVNNIFAG